MSCSGVRLIIWARLREGVVHAAGFGRFLAHMQNVNQATERQIFPERGQTEQESKASGILKPQKNNSTCRYRKSQQQVV